jgi:hypothetical protein
MPRYYFHFENGHRFSDDEGVDLAHADDARLEATKLLAQLVLERPEELWLSGNVIVSVVDEAGLTMFLLDLAVTTSPSAPPCRLTRR